MTETPTLPIRQPPTPPSSADPGRRTTAVRPSALAEHAAQVIAAARGVPRSAWPDAARAVAAAWPGSRSAAAAEALARRWEAAVRAWLDEVDVHGVALRASAHDYQDTDAGTAGSFRAHPSVAS